ncbi:MAG: hypothetical protein JW827_06700 [Spirochaetes bacterium]|nr:hypothetical protein [Spirochaetota bacterium]
MKKNDFLIMLILLLLSVATLGAQQSEKKTQEGNLPQISLDWPFDRYTGFANYAQELVFYRDMGLKYLAEAKKEYRTGFSLIERYQKNPESYDPYLRKAYETEVGSPTDISMRKDFRLAQAHFNKALDISARYMNWDPKIYNNPEYEDLIKNCYKNMVFTAVYNGDYYIAMNFITEYKTIFKDKYEKEFVAEWEARIMGSLVKLHEAYAWNFVGRQSADQLKRDHKKMLDRIIDERYSSEPKMAEEIKTRMYPPDVLIEVTTKDTEEKSTPTK